MKTFGKLLKITSVHIFIILNGTLVYHLMFRVNLYLRNYAMYKWFGILPEIAAVVCKTYDAAQH